MLLYLLEIQRFFEDVLVLMSIHLMNFLSQRLIKKKRSLKKSFRYPLLMLLREMIFFQMSVSKRKLGFEYTTINLLI